LARSISAKSGKWFMNASWVSSPAFSRIVPRRICTGLVVNRSERTPRSTHHRKERIVREHGGEQESEEREENSAEQQLVRVVLPCVRAVAQHVEALACRESANKAIVLRPPHAPRNRFQSEPPVRRRRAYRMRERT
jgi:hypothetical protein